MKNQRVVEWVDAAISQGWTVLSIDQNGITVNDGYGIKITLEFDNFALTVGGREDGRIREYLRRTPRLSSYYMDER